MKGWTWLNDFTFTFHFHALEKEMATHFSVLAWRIPGRAEPGGLLSVGSHRVRHDWSDLAAHPVSVGNLISCSSAFSKSSLNLWKFLVHILLKHSLENFEHYLASMWNECSFLVVGTFFGIALLWDWNENWPFPVLWSLLFSKFRHIECSTLTASSFRIWNNSVGIPSPPKAS